MKFEQKVFWMRQKYYFDLGVGITSLLIKLLLVVGIASAVSGAQTNILFLFGIIYAAFCYLLGYAYVRFEWFTASLEVENRLNKFQQEMREGLEKQKA